MESKETINQQPDDGQIAYFYDKNTWKIGETYRMRVSHIFDISKFWIVLLEQELTVFQKFINNIYLKNRDQYKMPPEKLHRNMYCVAFTDGSFFRGIIVDIPFLTSNVQKAMVFLIDFGQVVPVEFNEIYNFYEKFYQVPSFAVRACLSHIQPCDGNAWPIKSIQRFNELVCGKVLLCVLENTDSVNRVVYIRISDIDQNSQVHDIGDILLKESLAIPITARIRRKKVRRLKPICKYPYLFPTFEAIEQCDAPPNAKIFDLVKQSRGSFALLESYYGQNDTL